MQVLSVLKGQWKLKNITAIFKTRNGELVNGNGEQGTGNGEPLKWGIFKMGIFKSGNL